MLADADVQVDLVDAKVAEVHMAMGTVGEVVGNHLVGVLLLITACAHAI